MVRPWVVFAIGVLLFNYYIEARAPQLAAKNVTAIVVALSALMTGLVELLVWALRRIRHRIAVRAEKHTV
jgi:hypothetical protein